MKRYTISLILIAFYLLSGYAQGTSVFSGVVKDAYSKAIADASICLRNSKDSSYIASSKTLEDGSFRFKDVPSSFFLQIVHLAYNPYWATINADHPKHVDIVLEDATYSLGEVVVKSESNFMRSRNGNLVVDVSKITTKSESLGNLLNKLPGVSNHKGESLSLYGLSAVVYIDGVKQNMSSTTLQDYLQSLPADSFSEVELISIPDGTYEASSNAVIKIKSEKAKADGYYLKVGSANVLYDHAYSGGGDIFYMLKKKNVTFNLSASYLNDYTNTATLDSTHYALNRYLTTSTNSNARLNVFKATGNLNYLLKNNDAIRFNFFVYDDYGKPFSKWNIKNHYNDEVVEDNETKKSKSHDDLWSTNIQYESSDSAFIKLKASYGFVYGGLRSDNNYYNNNGGVDEEFMFSKLRMIGSQHLFNLDVDKTVGRNHRFFGGANSTLGHLNDDADYFIKESIPSSTFSGTEFILGLFGGWGYKLSNSFSMRLSLRGEYTNYNLNIKSSSIEQRDKYWNLFPYYSVSYSSKNYSTILGFVSGIIRPNYEWLLPGIRYSNDYLYNQGNPYLKPTQSYAVAWNNTFYKYAYLNVRYSYYKNLFGSTFEEESNGVVKSTYLNYADQHKFSTYLTLPFRFLDGNLLGQITGNVDYARYVNIAPNYEISNSRKKDYLNYTLSSYIQYQLNRFGVNVSANFYPGYSDLQMDVDNRWLMNIGVSYDFLKSKRLTLSIDANDLFDSYNTKSHYYLNNVYKYIQSERNNRNLSISIIYKFDSGAKVLNKYTPNEMNDVNRFGQ